MSFQKVVKRFTNSLFSESSFRTVSFQKVVKPIIMLILLIICFRTVSFQKVVKLVDGIAFLSGVLELCHFRR